MVSMRNSIRIVEAGDVAATFNVSNFLSQLRQVAIDLHRSAAATTPDAQQRKQALTIEIAGLVKRGMQQARGEHMSNKEGAELVAQMKKAIVMSGAPVNLGDRAADRPPAETPASSPVGDRTDLSVSTNEPHEMIFPDRLQRFVRKWEEGDPAWRLLQCATMKVGDEIRVIGFAETGPQEYNIFNGISGGNYKSHTVSLQDAQRAMKAAYDRGFTQIPTKTLAAKIGIDHVHNQQFTPGTRPINRTPWR